MKTKWGSLIVDGRGKIGGHVASKNRSGSYMRTKVTPVNGKTVSQQNVRSFVTSTSQAWKSLTEVQVTAWNAAVSGYSKTDIFGDIRNPSGLNLFVKLNCVLLSCGLPMLDTPPAPASVSTVLISACTVSSTAQSARIELNGAADPSTCVKVYATPPVSSGRSYLNNEYRLITVLPAFVNGDNILTSYYIAKFGNMGEAGQKVGFKIVPVNTTTGQLGAESSAVCITV